MKNNFLSYLQMELAKNRSQTKAMEEKAYSTGIENLSGEELIKYGQLKQDVTKIQYAIRAYQAWSEKKEDK